jgi:hypothetical protein
MAPTKYGRRFLYLLHDVKDFVVYVLVSSSNKAHPLVMLSIIELVLCTFADKEACDLKTSKKSNIYS